MTDQDRTEIENQLRTTRIQKDALEAMMTAPMFSQWTPTAQAQHASHMLSLSTTIAVLQAKLADSAPPP